MTIRPNETNTSNGILYARAMESTERYVSAIRDDQWGDPTPCSDWNVRDIVNHITNENLWAVELFAGKRMEDVGNRLDGDLLGSDPIGAYHRSVLAAADAAQAPGSMERTCHLSFGDYPGSELAKQLFLDTLIHGWDIAKATGQDTRLDPSLVEACYPVAQALEAQFGQYGVFGSKLTVPKDADTQTKILALLGRKA